MTRYTAAPKTNLESTVIERAYDFFFRFAAEGILMVNTHQEIIHMNPAAAALLHTSLEDCIGRATRQAFKKQPPLIRLLTIGGVRQLDIPLPKDRLATGIATDLPIGRVALLHDVTEQRDLESRREALVKAVAHDLRNPLNALAGYANLVETGGTSLNDVQKKFLTRIQQTTNKLYEMSAKLVDLAWIEAGMPLQYVPVELASLTRDVIRELSSDARYRRVTIVNSLPNEMPTVIGDPKRLKQTIYNILDNAIRYSLPNENVVIHAWHQDDKVFYTIADKGIGIAKDEQDKVWDRLWRSNDERVREIPGGGIGLSFAKIIITRHGGQIELESILDSGTTLTFSLPITR